MAQTDSPFSDRCTRLFSLTCSEGKGAKKQEINCYLLKNIFYGWIYYLDCWSGADFEGCY